MNDHVPDSSRLPLRAMVMVLLFLGTIFLLVGLQALGSSNSDEDSAHTATSKAVATSSAEAKPERVVHKPEVRVYNISEQAGLAGRTADQLREAGWNVTDVSNLELPQVTENTVYFSDAEGEHEAANSVGELLHAVVEPRIPDVAEQPPGIIVVVAG
ncbi:LytR C-terminal domain-containing protein [Mycolicibacter sp. MYC123]|uniref:LytR C-terminal domain-containing protein n=2 Tax=Mycolicibacter TaxID=1073531 RepID=A0ABU5YIV7_9MYCO|nr:MULTISPECIES: LytR C-terminal domain-containing protein [unclassified Mycolicibacter]MEB3049986.1 LytR C-terminal domain-containing protein [Mycolicibacter sp. MYC123]MEB3062350.1 LytR C-terminal domain-containing protein [Mycolicibacter sp. MYC101]MEB3069710.1 LytR C-terminal domain-containing protein [Mycolicibacter sp. MYC017]